MRRFLVSLLSFADLLVPTSPWGANTSKNPDIVTPGRAITPVNLSDITFLDGVPSGTVVGRIGVAAPSSPIFSGSLSLNEADTAGFNVVDAYPVTNMAGAYQIIITPTANGTLTVLAPSSSTPELPGLSAQLSTPHYARRLAGVAQDVDSV
jgi:hypothetical protein